MKKSLIIGLYAYLIIMIGIYVFSWTPHGVFKPQPYSQVFHTTKLTLPIVQRFLGFFLDGVMLGMEAVMVIFLLRIVRAESFYHISRHLQKLSYLFLAYSILDFLFEPLYSMITTYHQGLGQIVLAVTFGLNHLQYILVSLLFALMVRHINRAYLLEREQALTI